MRNPAGQECSYFYGDYFRGRTKEECRLLDSASLEWNPQLCRECPMPKILHSNACENMKFYPRINRGFLKKTKVIISTYCTKCECNVDEPRVGCGQCHQLPDAFLISPDIQT